jgi:hypothetical protein
MQFNKMIRSWVYGSLPLAAALGLHTSALADGPPADVLTVAHDKVKAVIAVQDQVTSEMMKLPGILGTAVGLDDAGAPALVLYVDQDSPKRADIVRSLPPQIRGIAVKVELTEKFRAFKGPPGGGGGGTTNSPTAKQTAPIQLGTSGGWSSDLANGYCCGGTLGSLIQVNGLQYIMSNYHVFEADIVPGGNGVIAQTGQAVIQPGLIDVSCNVTNAQAVATLVTLGSLPSNNVDVSVAQVVPGMVRTDGSILGIGTLSGSTVAASLRQGVKKSGRTTGLTTSTISGLNATISVTYDNECAGGTAFTKTFTGQIVIANKGSAFLNSGDSGSLLVENTATNPRAVGLLYAGGGTSAIANPIDEVLTFVGSKLGGTATMVGN